MSMERLIFEGQKSHHIREAKKLEMSISNLRTSIRTELNPHVPISDIDEELVGNMSIELAEKLAAYKSHCRQIDAIHKDLGIS